MKIGDNPLAAQTPAQRAVTPHKAASWLAQLERAWLNSWQGERPAGQGADGGHQPGRGAEQANASTPVSPSRTSERQVVASAGQTPGRVADPGSSQADLPSTRFIEPVSPHERVALPVLEARPTEAGTDTETEHSNVVSTTAAGASKAVPVVQLKASLPVATREVETEGEAAMPAHSSPDQAPGTTPARSALQVAVAQDTAQVSLRDASLSKAEASRISQRMAHQLLETGLASVRLYVNGQVSQHERGDPGRARPSQTANPGVVAESFHPINPLERK